MYSELQLFCKHPKRSKAAPMRFLRVSLVAMLLAGCGEVSMQADAGPARDAGKLAVDAGSTLHQDAGQQISIDSGTAEIDAGTFDAGALDAGSGLPDPVLFIHGINGSAADWDVMIKRLKADGWPADRLMARTFGDPKWGCNVNNANTIKQWAEELMATTHSTRFDLVVHSMGTLSSRKYVKDLGGTAFVNTYVILGGMNHGLGGFTCVGAQTPVAQCVWKELCESFPYVAAMNAPPATPPPTTWVTIAGTADDTVPNDSTFLQGAENIVVPGVTHAGATGLQQDITVYQDVVRVLRYPGH